MAAIPGTSMILQVDVTAVPTNIGLERSSTLTIAGEVIDITTKADNNWRVNLSSIRDWNVDFEAVFDEADTAQDELFSAVDSDPPVTVDVTMNIGGDDFTGNAFVTELTFEGAHDGEVTLSGSLTGTASLTKV